MEQRLESQAEDVNAAEYPGRDSYLGWGRLNVYNALAGLAPGPTPTPTVKPTPTVSPTPQQYQLRLLLIYKDWPTTEPESQLGQ